MGLHKLTAGDGYTYLTRQVAAHDSTEKGHASLGDYYSEQGESPGRWLGAGLVGLDLDTGAAVTEAQMRSLFGQGRHPNAAELTTAVIGVGGTPVQAVAAGALGRPFNVYDAASVFQVQVARAFTTYNRDQGAAWNAPIPSEVRATIRTGVATRLFTDQHGRPPQDSRELAGYVAEGSRQATTAVAGYDLTFSPVKSVSVLWALVPRNVADQVLAAHDAAVADTIGWLEREAVFTRVGHAGARQVRVRGLVAAAFTHRDSRAGDPDLHTHVAISNKVQTLDHEGTGAGGPAGGGGRWLAVDGRLLYKANVAASERYNTRLEGELTARLGVRFVDRPAAAHTHAGAGGGRRPVREIAGVNPLLSRWWSTRRRDIQARSSQLVAGFQTAHGRPPTAVEAIGLAQQATLETRDAKHEPRSEAEQRATWRHQANRVLGGYDEVDAMVEAVLGHSPSRQPPTQAWAAGTGAAVVGVMEQSRATWQVWHLRAEAERQARAANISLADIDEAVDRAVDAAIAQSIRLGVPDPVQEPPVLRRLDGESVYDVHGATPYTSARVLDAEQRLLAAAKTGGARTISETRVQIAVAEEAADGVALNDAQTGMVRDLATSGARLRLAVAPAGTGKTTAMRVLGRAWTDAGGDVLGLAPSAQAAHELGQALDGHTDTLAKLTWTLTNGHLEPGKQASRPGWIDQIGPRTLVVIDEAGQAATADLATAVDYITARGGCVRLVGDDQQLASVAASGVLRDIAAEVGAVTVTEVHRFEDPAEAAATLAIRDGDPGALGFYADHQRIHIGDIGSVTDQAYDAWTTDRHAGLDTILLAPTRDLVTRLNTRARTDRLTTTATSTAAAAPPGTDQFGAARSMERQVRLADGTHASAGDTILTRRNERRLTTTGTTSQSSRQGRTSPANPGGGDWVRNGDRWIVQAVHPDGSLTARRLTARRPTTRPLMIRRLTTRRSDAGAGRTAARGLLVTLPADYVSEDVQLGYATTVHAAQGMTTDTAHTVLSGDEPRQLAYVALSRGRQANHLYLATAPDGDPHTLIRPETLAPPTAIDLLTTILGRDGSQQSATTTRRDLDSPATQLHAAAARYGDALGFAATQTIGPDILTALGQQIDALWPGLTHEPAYPTLRDHLALLALDGTDPLEALTDTAQSQGLGTAYDRAAVLDWRLTINPSVTAEDGERRPLPWLPAIPATLAANPDWGPYLGARARRISALAAQVHDQAVGWSPTQTPTQTAPWARHLTGPAGSSDATLRGDLAVWRAVHATPDSDPRPTGAHQPGGDAAHHQRDLDRRVREHTGTSRPAPPRRWDDVLPDLVCSDARVSELHAHLASLDRAQVEVTALLSEALSLPRPLPIDCPADALWWRVVRHLGPATIHATAHATANAAVNDSSLLRPTWTATLIEHLSTQTAARVMTDPAWPALVAAVNAHPPEWTPAQLIVSATQGLTNNTVSAQDLCGALVRRVAILTDPPEDLDDPQTWEGMPPDPSSAHAVPATETHLAPVTAPHPASPASASSDTPAARITDLNRAAMHYYQHLYPRSWAPRYLKDRLGTDLTGHPEFRIGYAPPGPTSLIRHLSRAGATEQELLTAGLARRTHRGHLIDTFRDRLVFPIYHHHDLAGFIARRNPTHDHQDPNHEYAGPKYLNTRNTRCFSKGDQLYGLTEGAHRLAQGAIPVLVEGPLDAIAVTLSGDGHTVGVAPLGTALTDTQAGQLKTFFRDKPDHVAVATDPDTAGWRSARRAFWILTQHGANPQHVRLPDGQDPADLLRTSGPQTLHAAVLAAQPLARTMIDALSSSSRDDLHSPADRLRLIRQAGQIIGALPPDDWMTHIDRVTQQLNLPVGMLHLEVADAGHDWTANPRAAAAQRLAEMTTPGHHPSRVPPPANQQRTTQPASPGPKADSGNQPNAAQRVSGPGNARTPTWARDTEDAPTTVANQTRPGTPRR